MPRGVRDTPAFPIPVPARSPPRLDPPARGLNAPITIVTPRGSVSLATGMLTIGRLPGCDIQLDDEIVSRRHALLRVVGQAVWVEDCHSTNGVFLNGERVLRAALLREGDRLLIGANELSVFDEAPDARVVAIQQRDTVPPPSRAGSHQSEPRQFELQPDRDRRAAAPSSAQVPPTARADVLRVLGETAARLAEAGNVERAQRVLQSQLDKVLDGAYAGLDVPESVSSLCTELALRLAGWTRHAQWLDYVIELHLCLRRVPSDELIDRFEPLFVSIPNVDMPLFRYYVDYVNQHQDLLTREDTRRALRLFALSSS